MGTPVVALFGPSGDREWGPWGAATASSRRRHPCRPCGHGRLRRRQGQRMPDDAAGGAGARGVRRTADVETRHRPPEIHALRRRRALRRTRARRTARAGRRGHRHRPRMDRATPPASWSRNPFYLGRTWRDVGFARCVQQIIAARPLRSGAKPRAHSRLPHLPRRRRRPCNLARTARPGARRPGALRSPALALAPLHAGRRGGDVPPPGAARRDLQFAHGARTTSRAASASPPTSCM